MGIPLPYDQVEVEHGAIVMRTGFPAGLIQIPMSELEIYAGQFGNKMIMLQDGCLRFQRGG